MCGKFSLCLNSRQAFASCASFWLWGSRCLVLSAALPVRLSTHLSLWYQLQFPLRFTPFALQIFVIFLSVSPVRHRRRCLLSAAAAVGPQIISNMFCRRCWIDFTTGEDYIVCSGPCAWPYHATCARVPRDLARELRRSSSGNFAGMEWYCRNCRQLYRLQLYFEVAITSAPRPRGEVTRNRRTQPKDTFMR